MDIKVDQSIIDYLFQNNGDFYNLHKASEEMLELGLVLNQKLLKPKKVEDQEIIDEIGDVIIRLEVLKRKYSLEDIQNRVDKKLADYKEWIDKGTYKKI